MLVFAELLDLLCERHYLLFCTKHAEYFKNILCRNLMQQQICLKDFRNCRAQVASCVPLTSDISLFFSCGPVQCTSHEPPCKQKLFGLLLCNSEERLAFASGVTDFGGNWHWTCAVCLSASESLTLTLLFT